MFRKPSFLRRPQSAAPTQVRSPPFSDLDQLKKTEEKGIADNQALALRLHDWAMQFDNASGARAVALCEELRASGMVPVISNLLTHELVWIHQLAINITGNLAHSLAVDPRADLSQHALKEAGAFDHLLPHLFSTDHTTLLFALAAIQNMCTEIEYVDKLKDAGGITRLQHIVGLADSQLLQFAQGTLDNIRNVTVINAMQQQNSRTGAQSITKPRQALGPLGPQCPHGLHVHGTPILKAGPPTPLTPRPPRPVTASVPASEEAWVVHDLA
jgi:hypothetical protein